jgi:hypothetical protein
MASWTGTYTPQPGDTFIQMGCDVWTNSDLPVSWQWSGSPGNRITITVDKTWYNSTNCPSAWNRPLWDAQKAAISGGTFLNPNAGGSDGHDFTFDNIEMIHWEAASNTTVISWMGNTSVNESFTNLYIHAWDASTDSNCTVIDGPWGEGSDTSSNIVFQYNVITGIDRTGTSGTNAVCYCFYTDYYGVKILNNYIGYIPNVMVGGGGTGSQVLEMGGNLFEDILVSAGGVNHCNVIETQHGTFLFHDNVIRNYYCGGGYSLAVGEAANEIDYVWNNVIYGLDISGNVAQPPQTGVSFSGIQTYFWNNTVIVGATATTPCLMQTSGGSPTGIYVNAQNNHCISSGSSAIDPTFASEGTLVSVDNLLMTPSTATADGYTSSQTYAYSPTASNSPTVGQGANLTSSMGTWVSGFTTSDTQYGCTYNQSAGTVSCPGRTPNIRPSTGAWDAGAYLFGDPSPAPQPPTNVQATPH